MPPVGERPPGINEKKMRTTIINKLKDIEKAHGITMLYACESGSRAWQFPSPDSDFDVRFIYIRPVDFYLSILDNDDQLSFPINDELDIYGWDLKKVLKLVRKSNTTPFEWLQSPIVYGELHDFRETLWKLCPHYFNRKSNIHHYLGIAKGALDTVVNNNEIKIKKLFYVLRPLLAAKWCLEQNSIAPMIMGPLLTLMPAALAKMVEKLIDFKATANEGHVINIDPELRTYIDEQFSYCSAGADELASSTFEVGELETFFRKTLYRYDHSRT